jgi:hypothetical protein
MAWVKPSFEVVKMDAEARSYGSWVADVGEALDLTAAAAQQQPVRDAPPLTIVPEPAPAGE